MSLPNIGSLPGGINRSTTKSLAFLVHGAADVPQDRHRPLVVPVVQDVSQQIGVGPDRHRLQKTAADHPAAINEPRRPNFVSARPTTPGRSKRTPCIRGTAAGR